jgi:hypothetical protein
VSRWNDYIGFKAATWIFGKCHCDEKTISGKEAFVALNV